VSLVDITIPAQKFLSCVKRTGERFGAKHVTDVLRGSHNAKVQQFQHDQLSTYGIGTELTEKQWMHLARQLVQLDYLNQESEYRTLSLTEKAIDMLKNRRPILGKLQEVEERPRNKKAAQTELEYNHALYAILRQTRKELADTSGVPPYVIFSDKTLVEMAAYYPQSAERLMDISGVGQVKANQFGEIFLERIKAYCLKHGIAEKRKETKREKSDSGRRYFFVGEAYNAGESIESLMARYGVMVGTILENLARYIAAGNPLRKGSDLQALVTVPEEDQKAVFSAFEEIGTTFLKPVFDRLEGRLNYDDLKLLRILYLASIEN
jgi:ATP-dependent DNA helicase RecQ